MSQRVDTVALRPASRHRVVIGGIVITVLLIPTIVFLYSVSIVETPGQLLVRAESQLANGDFHRAFVTAEKLVGRDPQSVDGWKILAEGAGKRGEFDRACQALDEYANRRPSHDAGRFALRVGRDWMMRNRVRHAAHALRTSERLGFEVTESLQLQEQIAAVTGHGRETVRCIIELIKRKNFRRNDLLLVTSIAPSVGDPARLEAILRTDSANKSPLLVSANQKLNLNLYHEAEQLLMQITTAHPDDVEAMGTLAELYARFMPDKFHAWQSQLSVAARDDARFWSALGQWLMQRGENESAARCLHEALLREPEQLSTTAILGQLLKTLNETELGSAFSERGRHLQRIVDLNSRMNEPRANEYVRPLIEELEATGRLWEAWGWCAVAQQSTGKLDAEILALKTRIEPQLHATLPRTRPDCLPGVTFDWSRYPLPDWSQQKSSVHDEGVASMTESSAIRFADRATDVGIDFRFVNSYSVKEGRRIFEAMGAGVAVLDYDLDGWPDLYFPQGNTSPTATTDGPSDQLFRNGRGQKYQNVTDPSGIRELTYSQGIAAGDFNNDGFPDLYIANLGRNTLYVNQGDGTFADVTDQAGITQNSWTVSCAIADLNGDGLPDLFDVNYVQGPDLLTGYCTDSHGRRTVCRPTVFDPALDSVLINLGDGRFETQQAEAGLDLPQGMGLGLVIADFNDDNKPDIFIANDMTANYLLINQQANPDHPFPTRDRPNYSQPNSIANPADPRPSHSFSPRDRPSYSEPNSIASPADPRPSHSFSPRDRPSYSEPNSIASPPDPRPGHSFPTRDRPNYSEPNSIANPADPRPGHSLHFRDEALLRNVALDQFGLAQACMGIACADINRDRLPDLLVTNFAQEANTLYLSQPDGFYVDWTQAAGLRKPSFEPLGFGAQFLDADNDGWHDLAVVNGHIDDFVNQPFRMKAQLFRGHADHRFTELQATSAGAFLDKPRLGRGMALLDWNRDGRVDFIATDLEESQLLAENQTDSRSHSLRFRLIGTRSNRDAIGAKVRVTVDAGDDRYLQVTAGDGYQSSNERILRVGIDDKQEVERVEIRWPSGDLTHAEHVRVDHEWLVIEGLATWLTQP